VRVLVVEDDDRVAAALRAALERHEMQVERVSRGLAVLPNLAGADVVLLDLGLPDVDGLEVCRRIREAGDVPVIVVSARGRVDERILGLHHGADDYLVKPFDVGELVARIHAVRRRRGTTAPTVAAPVAELGDGVVLDRARHALTVDGAEVALSRKEFAVLTLLADADGAVCTRDRLVAEVWGRRWPGADRTLDVHVATLRTKLGRPGMVATVRGVGYRLAAGA
jgi:DNA-binding response OmpR family regulator